MLKKFFPAIATYRHLFFERVCTASRFGVSPCGGFYRGAVFNKCSKWQSAISLDTNKPTTRFFSVIRSVYAHGQQNGRLPPMKSRFGQLWFVLTACCLLLAAISLAANVFPVRGQVEIAHSPQKNPKLSTPLSSLSLNVKQEKARPAVAEAVRPPVGFSTE